MVDHVVGADYEVEVMNLDCIDVDYFFSVELSDIEDNLYGNKIHVIIINLLYVDFTIYSKDLDGKNYLGILVNVYKRTLIENVSFMKRGI